LRHLGRAAGTRELLVPGLPFVIVCRIDIGDEDELVILGAFSDGARTVSVAAYRSLSRQLAAYGEMHQGGANVNHPQSQGRHDGRIALPESGYSGSGKNLRL
jgi:hypothetical protein